MKIITIHKSLCKKYFNYNLQNTNYFIKSIQLLLICMAKYKVQKVINIGWNAFSTFSSTSTKPNA